MPSTRASSRSVSGTGVLLNGLDLLDERGVIDRKRGVSLNELGIDRIPSDKAGFYIASNRTLGVLKLGKSDGGHGSGLRSRIMSLSRHWAGDVTIHDLRTFRSDPHLRMSLARQNPWLVSQTPRHFASKFEANIKRMMGDPNKEFYVLSRDLDSLLEVLFGLIQQNKDNGEEQERQLQENHVGAPVTRSKKIRKRWVADSKK